MSDLTRYLFESGVSLALFYVVYWVFLKNETLFTVNRFYLTLSILFSLAIPFFKIPSPFFVSTPAEDFLQTGQQMQSMGILRILWLVYFGGVGVFFLRFCVQLGQLFILVKKYGVQKRSGYHFVFTDKNFSDFTFFKLIFLNKSKLSEKDFRQIIAHERIHIEQYHTLDSLLVELLIVFQWCNPFVWLYKSSIKETHEYLADEAVIAQGCDTAKYQLLIFERFVGVRLFDLASNFHQSQIKRRIAMMTKHKSKRWARYKVLLILPAFAFLVLAFAKPRTMAEEKEKKAATEVQLAEKLPQDPEKKAELEAEKKAELELKKKEKAEWEQMTDAEKKEYKKKLEAKKKAELELKKKEKAEWEKMTDVEKKEYKKELEAKKEAEAEGTPPSSPSPTKI